jgi:hypothetical protein
MSENWCKPADLAAAAGLSVQQIRNICRAGYGFGHTLKVRAVKGKGGASGKQYEVAIDSLPEHFKARLKPAQSLVIAPSRALALPRSGGGIEAGYWHTLLQPVLNLPKGSAARTAAYDAILAQPNIKDGQPHFPSLRTLTRRVANIEAVGMAGLARPQRADAGKARVILSRQWDKAVPFDDDIKAKIAESVRLYIRSLVKGGARISKVRFLARDRLLQETQAHGHRPNDVKALERACSITKHMVEAENAFKAVYLRNHDRKASDDASPRQRRNSSNLSPMEVVVMDVHHINVLLDKSSGRTGTAKILAFMDARTRRVWCELIFFDKKGGVRNADNIEAFLTMAQDPSFGLPQFFHCDNGSEYFFTHYLDDAIRLNIHLDLMTGKRNSPIIKALPYNAAAKPIEGWFGYFEQQVLRHCPGWIDDNRMNPARPEMGRLPASFEGGFDAFQDYFFKLLNAYEHFPQSGALANKSPAETFQGFVDRGWAATLISPDNLLTVFTKREKRAVEKHSIKVDGRFWTCPELDRYLENSLTACIPVYHGFNELLLLDRKGNEIGVATPDKVFDYFDQRGARRSAARKADRNKAIRALDKSVPDVNVGAEIIAFGERRSPPIPNAPRGIVSVTKGGRAAKVAETEYGSNVVVDRFAERSAEAQRLRSAGVLKLAKGRFGND